jgi:tetraacyldisaccharide 4'-kinase
MKTLQQAPAGAASGLYRLGVELRLAAYRRGWLRIRRLPVPVISVGNLETGGTGKTPHVALIAAHFRDRGIRTAVLSRGYRGTATGPGAVISTPEKVVGTVEAGGEEPFWLAGTLPGVPVLVGKDRYRSGLWARERFGSDLVILDDGFQHLELARQADLLLLPAPRLFGNGRLLPAGPLREPKREIRRADLILITHSEMIPQETLPALISPIRERHPAVPVFFSRHEPQRLWQFPGARPLDLDGLRDRTVLAFCGLARPASFLFSLDTLGARVVRMIPYRDHHPYRFGDVQALARRAASLGVEAVVTTEKDILKIADWPSAAPPLFVLGVQARVAEPGFWKCLEEKIRKQPLSNPDRYAAAGL